MYSVLENMFLYMLSVLYIQVLDTLYLGALYFELIVLGSLNLSRYI